MPRAYREDVSCIHCGAAIITDGKLTCPRCHESVQMYSIQDVTRDEEGRWKCQKCLEHGKRPKTLAIGDEIQCRVCPEKTKNYLFEKPFDGLRVKESEMSKTAAVKTELGTTKLTTKEYNALLQGWLREEKKKKKDLGEKEIGLVAGEIAKIDRRIESLEKAIALGFDPDEFERVMNIPLRAIVSQPLPDLYAIIFKGIMINRLNGTLYLNQIRVDATTAFEFYPLSRLLEINIAVEVPGNQQKIKLFSHRYYGIEGFRVENTPDGGRISFYTDEQDVSIRCDGYVRGNRAFL